VSRIAVVGLGRMGGPMAAHLRAAGHALTVCDLDEAAVRGCVEAGDAAAATPARAAAGADVVITMLPSPAAVEQATLGADGVLAGARAGSVLLEMSTGPPALARRLASAGEAVGVDVLDAPVSGGPPGAQAGTLAIMVGGSAHVLERVRGLLDLMGSVIMHMGPPGAGQATKLCNNLLAGVHMAAIAESVALARREGLDPAALLEVMRNGTGDSRVLRMRFPVPGVLPEAPASRGFAPLFPVDLIAKDLALALDAAREQGLDAPVARAALDRYAAAQAEGLGPLDYSAVFALLEPGVLEGGEGGEG
jgi:3-hydroxyisobutyrate dehydrogenase